MRTILIVSAHPDDETLFCGGTIAMYIKKGHHVVILETTRGEGGEVGDPPLTTKDRLGVVREAEVRAAAAALGVETVYFLPYVDPHMEIGGTALAIDVPLDEFTKAVSAYLEQVKPDLVITHGRNGEYGHPQHVFTHQAVIGAFDQVKPASALMTWQAWHEPFPRPRVLNPDDPADIIRDITPWMSFKVNAALCHKTQHAMFLRNTGADRVEDMIWGEESFCIRKGPVPEDL